LLERVDTSELAKHIELVLPVLRDAHATVTARMLAMQVVNMLSSAAVAPHAQLVLQSLWEPNEGPVQGPESDAAQLREEAAMTLRSPPLPVLAPHIPELLDAIKDNVASDSAMYVLSGLPPAILMEHIPAVLHALLLRPRLPCDDGVDVLRRVGPSALAFHISALQEPLRHADRKVRRNALALLAEFSPYSLWLHAKTLRTLLSDPDRRIKKMSVELLGQLPTQGLADELSTLLGEPEHAGVRAGMLPVLGKLSGSAAPPPAAMRLLHDRDPAVRASAIGTLARLDPKALQEHAGLLLTALGDSDARVRTSAMEVFAHFSAAALAEHVPALLRGLKDPRISVQGASLRALQKVDKLSLAAHTTVLVGMLLASATPMRTLEAAAQALCMLPPPALAPYLMGLLTVFGNGQPNFEAVALWHSMEHVLKRVVTSMTAESVAGALTIGLDNTDRAGERKAAALDHVFGLLPLETLGLHAELLVSLSRDPDARVRESAFRTLGVMEPSQGVAEKKHTALLVGGLTDPIPAARFAAIAALCKLPAEVLAPRAAELQRMLWDPDSSVREAVMQQAEEMRIHFGAAPLRGQLRRAAIDACMAKQGPAVGDKCEAAVQTGV
jgi:HEAT repeat protein